MTSIAVKENVRQRDSPDRHGVEPKKHPDVVCRPKVVHDPFNKSSVQQGLIENVDNVSGEERPKQNVQT